ncbi:MAG: YitT family protein [Candidatus Riflebacteria bacterium]|nr:YitT family protein [Candidatus Riflebacteria bacterium]
MQNKNLHEEQEKKTLPQKLKPWFWITVGTLLTTFGYVIFILPLNLFEGGVTGLGIAVARIIGNIFYDGKMPGIVGLVSWTLTLIAFGIALKVLGKAFGWKSLYATTIMYGSMDISLWYLRTNGYTDKIVAMLSQEMLMPAIYGALCVGAGMAMVFNQEAATGGGDAFYQIIRKVYNIPIAKTMFITDICILILLFFTVKDTGLALRTLMYSLIFITLQAITLDRVMNGFKASQIVTIITNRPEEIKKAILHTFQAGVTEYECVGGYTGEKRKALVSVTNIRRMPKLRTLIREIDPEAFVILQDTAQVYGKGFEGLPV